MSTAKQLIAEVAESGPVSHELLDAAIKAAGSGGYEYKMTPRGLKFSFSNQMSASNFWHSVQSWNPSGMEDDRSTYGRWCVYIRGI